MGSVTFTLVVAVRWLSMVDVRSANMKFPPSKAILQVLLFLVFCCTMAQPGWKLTILSLSVAWLSRYGGGRIGAKHAYELVVLSEENDHVRRYLVSYYGKSLEKICRRT